MTTTTALWAGIDAGKGHHHCVVIDNDGNHLLSRKVDNDENDILNLIGEVTDLTATTDTRELTWSTDLNHGGAALLLSLLLAHGQTVLYIPGRTIHAASQGYRGDGKTDAKDAAIIADQARMRRDLTPIRPTDDIASTLRLLTARRTDLVCDRTRAYNRLRATLLEFFPALERAFDFAGRKAAIILLTRYQTPTAIRHAGASRIAAWLVKQKTRSSSQIADTAVAAARSQYTTVPGEQIGAELISRLAVEILRLTDEIEEVEAQTVAQFRQHKYAELLTSVPGIGPQLGAEFIASIGGSIDNFESADRLAGVAGVAPVPKDSGKISGNHHRPRRYDRRLSRVCFLSAQVAARTCPESQAYYAKKRAEGKNHKQAVLALSRRRINVIWAILRDGEPFKTRENTSTGVPIAA